MVFHACMQALPAVKLPENPTTTTTTNPPTITFPRRHREKVVVVIGATGAGKSRLSIDLATRYGGEVINSDKIQVYKGLDVIANKATAAERGGVPHHLLDFVDPDDDFTAADFVRHAAPAAESAACAGRLPIVAGGSVSFVKALVAGGIDAFNFCFIWVDSSMDVLRSALSRRVDVMVARGLVEEAREFYAPDGDYGRGIRRAIGVPEMDKFFRYGGGAEVLAAAIDEIKENTFKLACKQVESILRLSAELGVPVLRVDGTAVLEKDGADAAEEWRKAVVEPSVRVLSDFVGQEAVKKIYYFF